MRQSQDVNVLAKEKVENIGIGGLRYALPVTAVIVAADQATKQWALSRLTQGPCSVEDACVELIGGARFHLTFNTGASFQTGESFGPVIGVVAIVMSVVLFAMARQRSDRLGAILLGGIAGGAIGNLADRLFRADNGILSGAVVDFIEPFNWYPIFNIADMAIVCSVIAMITYSFLRPEVGVAGSDSDDSDQAHSGSSDGDDADRDDDQSDEISPDTPD